MTEMLDWVDEDDNVIGQVTRDQAHSEGYIHRSVLFFLFDNKGRVFVNQRTEDKDFYPLYWSIVFGGHVSSGQHYDSAVLREAEEEAGIVGTDPVNLGYFRKRHDALDRENIMTYGFITEQEPRLDPAEIRKGSFMTLDAMLEMAEHKKFLPETEDMVRILLKNYSMIRSYTR